jgi:tetratricopeptide (TPR) repeat protein
VDRAAEHLRCTVRPVKCPSPRAPPGRRADGFTDRSRTCPDLHRSIPEDAWVLAYRGETYQAMERYEEALADFNRAIELDPDLDWAIADRGETFRAMGGYEALPDFSRHRTRPR